MSLDIYGLCPDCGNSWDDGPIDENWHDSYSPPYRWSRLIGVSDLDRDRVTHWRCPDCGWTTPRDEYDEYDD